MKKNLALVLGTAIGLVLVSIFLYYSAGVGTGTTEFTGSPPHAGIIPPVPAGTGPTPGTETSIVQERNESVGTTIADDKITGDGMVSAKSDIRIKMIFGNEEVIVKMHDNPTTRDFLTLLPLTATLEDYSGTEKIAKLTRRLSTKDAPAGSDPSLGDFAYYAPWGNLAIFYRDFGYSDGLIILGSVEGDGVAKLAHMTGDSPVIIERIK